MRVTLVDPAAFTPQYDHELAAALGRAGADVELFTSRFRFGEAPAAVGYRRTNAFYPLSSRLRGRSRLRLPLRAIEHPLGMARLAFRNAGICHVQWLAAPELDDVLLRGRSPRVLTAHDLLPRRTATKTGLWQRLFARFERIVVHSARGRDALTRFGVPAERIRVISHPVFPSEVARSDDGCTLLCLGVIRPYKGLDDAIAVTKAVPDARLLVVGDPAEPVERYQATAGPEAEWRLGYLSDREIDRALAESTLALFPYRGEIDQSGALMRALGAGVPAVAYDVGGIAEPVRAFGAGRVVPAGDWDAMSAAVSELLGDPQALAEARAGAARARETLTWDASAAAHLALYRELA